MKILLDFLPIVLFFVAYKMTGDMITATLVLIPATLAQVAWVWWTTRRIETMSLVTLGLVVLLGGATVIFQDGAFIQWKPTIVNWLFAAAFLISPFFGGKTLIQRMMGHAMQLPQVVWKRLNFGWILFFIFMGAANLYVFSYFSEETWVNFKLFGMLGLTLVFVIAQGVYLAKHIQPTTSDTEKTE
ncbi:septation protein A [Allopseudospirillum japonicum]|nr:septation protein A [Allopseudospirillum japonicum]